MLSAAGPIPWKARPAVFTLIDRPGFSDTPTQHLGTLDDITNAWLNMSPQASLELFTYVCQAPNPPTKLYQTIFLSSAYCTIVPIIPFNAAAMARR